MPTLSELRSTQVSKVTARVSLTKEIEPMKAGVSLAGFVGQHRVRANLAITVAAARQKGEAMDHIFISGPLGSGKSTLARAVANEAEATYERISGGALRSFLDVSGVLSNLQHRQVLHIEDIDQLRPEIEKTIAVAARHFELGLHIGSGPGARIVTIPLQRFTLMGTTTGAMPKGLLRECFGLSLAMEPYTSQELAALLVCWAEEMPAAIEAEAVNQIASASSGNPQTAKGLLKRCSDLALVEGNGRITPLLAERALQLAQLNRPASAVYVNMTLSVGEPEFAAMSGYDFEEWAALQFQKLGYQVTRTALSGDHGIDLELFKNGINEIVQCKRWLGSVGEPVVRDFYGSLMHSRARSGTLLTTGSFTPAAVTFAAGKPISLLKPIELVALVQISEKQG